MAMKHLFLLCILFPLWVSGQQSLNLTDSSGHRQGSWEKKYPNGKLMYQGSFKDGKPVGQWKRWHDSGNLKAVMEYSETSDSVKAKLYESFSRPVAEGAYIGEKKCGRWTYYFNDLKIAEENFFDGKKNGISLKYYASGELLEESAWKDDLQDGKYRAFFTSGKPFLECLYSEGKRHGKCVSYYASGAPEVNSLYMNDLPEGTWTFYAENGSTLYTLLYHEGKLQNSEVLRTLDTRKLEELEKQRDRLLDPEKYLEDPEALMERKR